MANLREIKIWRLGRLDLLQIALIPENWIVRNWSFPL